MAGITLMEFCAGLYLGTVSGYGAKASESETLAFAEEMAQTIRNAYRDRGEPYGPTEDALMRYLEDNVTFYIES